MTPYEPTPAVRVVVVTYFPGDYLDAFLGSLPAASSGQVSVTVADNGSTDGSLERARERRGVEVVSTGSNLGYGGAANLGVAGTSETWVLVVNPDIAFEPGAIDDLLAVAVRRPRAGALGPRIHTSEGMLYPSARELPSLGRGIGHAAFGWVWPANPWTASYRRERGVPTEGVVGWLSGACLLLRREAFDAVGGFDEGYFMYFEDTDLCERLAQAGWEVVYAPSATVVHHGGHATVRNLDAMSKAHHTSAYRYLSHRYAGPGWAPVRGVLRAGLWGRYQLSRRVGRMVHGAQPTRPASPAPPTAG
jgi:N-acetylglucosaminyl-diphospho-decaprenol L-rhamnosyltransferase